MRGYILLPHSYDAFGKHQKTVSLRCRLLINMTSGVKVVVLLREYKNISNMSLNICIYNEFKQYRWYKTTSITPNKYKYSQTLKIGVQRSLV